MELYIIRHGQTDFNKANKVQGRGIDAPLNAKGRKQADLFFEAYRHIPFQKIYTSTLQRTHQSVAGFLGLGLKHTQLSGLDEISWGNQEGVAFNPVTAGLYEETVKHWKNGELNVAVGGGETPLQVMERQKPAMEQILSEALDPILICMHGRAMRILICWLLNYELSMMDEFSHQNLGLYKLIYTGSSFKIDLYNETSHLQAIQNDI